MYSSTEASESHDSQHVLEVSLMQSIYIELVIRTIHANQSFELVIRAGYINNMLYATVAFVNVLRHFIIKGCWGVYQFFP